MNNETIIMQQSLKLMDQGILPGSGVFGTVTDENGNPQQIELPVDIHTFAGWKALGFSVKKGEKAIAAFPIWKHTTRRVKDAAEDEEPEQFCFLKNSFFFAPSQVEPAKDSPGKQPAADPAPVESVPAEPAPAEPEPAAAVASADAEPDKTTAAVRFPINENLARRAKENRSFDDYKPGTATAEYNSYIEQAEQIAARQKNRVAPEYWDKIDSLLNAYSKKIAAYINKENEIGTRCPSIMIAGGSNFPVRKKEKQVAAWDRNHEEFKNAEALLDKIKSVGMGGIQSDDPRAIERLTEKLEERKRLQQHMKEANAEFRRTHTAEECKKACAYPSWALSNNNAEIHRLQKRIDELQKAADNPLSGWEFNGGKVVANADACRLQIVFEDKPDEATRKTLKGNGFRWAPSANAWQRLLNDNAVRVARNLSCLAPAQEAPPNADRI